MKIFWPSDDMGHKTVTMPNPANMRELVLAGHQRLAQYAHAAKREYGQRLSLIGGIDVDFLCRADEAAIRKRVRETIEICQPGGGFCRGSGNSVLVTKR